MLSALSVLSAGLLSAQLFTPGATLNGTVNAATNYVGIGTKGPTEKLTVFGEHRNSLIQIHSTGDGSRQSADLYLWASEPGESYTGTGIGNNIKNYNGTSFPLMDTSRGGSFIRLLDNEINFNLVDNIGTRVRSMTLASNGNVGIGSVNPDAKLTVKGRIHAEEVKVDLAVPADYVFEKYYSGKSILKPEYTMLTIEEIETFTQKNNHLPGIPSAKEIQEKGLNVGEMSNLLLQKIEELTLYTIEQNKLIKEQQKRIEKLEADNNKNN